MIGKKEKQVVVPMLKCSNKRESPKRNLLVLESKKIYRSENQCRAQKKNF
jgi:hypothetical protein